MTTSEENARDRSDLQRRLPLSLLIGLAGILALVLTAVLSFSRGGSERAAASENSVREEPVSGGAVEALESVDVIRRLIEPRTTIAEILDSEGFSPLEIHNLVAAVRPTYDLARIRAGRELRVERSSEGPLAIEYDIDEEAYLRVEVRDASYSAERVHRPLEIVSTTVGARIDLSLWQSVLEAGEDAGLVTALANLFQWDIDFTRIRKGDSFRALVEKAYLDGGFVRYGKILSAEFLHRGKLFTAYRFRDSGGAVSYFDGDGKAVRKAFLKAPFSFSPRVSSGYTHRRFHPIHKKWRPHLGVDYAAPAGTSVLASASGRVVTAGWNGGFGKQVRVRHPNGYTTCYGHLSRIAVRSGQMVEQGERLGRVGSTGVSTGAHLDYRVQDRHGRYIDPRRVIALPSDKPVAKGDWSRFVTVRDAFALRLRLPSYRNIAPTPFELID